LTVNPGGARFRLVRDVFVMLLLVVLLLGGLARPVTAMGVHYELDKPYYHPGDTGRLLLEATNDGPSDLLVFRAYMNISGIRGFEWDSSGLTPATDLPSGVHAYQFAKGQTLKLSVPFTIPAGTEPGNYRYTWAIVYGASPFGGDQMHGSDTFDVFAAGEAPPSPNFGELPVPFLTVAGLVVAVLGLLAGGIRRRVGGKRESSEMSSEVVRFKRRARTLTHLGLLATMAFFVLWFMGSSLTGPEPNAPFMYPSLHDIQPITASASFAGLLVAMISAAAGAMVAEGKIPSASSMRLRQGLGCAIVALALAPPLVDAPYPLLWYLPALVFAVVLLTPRRYSTRTAIILLVLAVVFALWPPLEHSFGIFGPAWSDLALLSGLLSPQAVSWSFKTVALVGSVLAEKAATVTGAAGLIGGGRHRSGGSAD